MMFALAKFSSIHSDAVSRNGESLSKNDVSPSAVASTLGMSLQSSASFLIIVVAIGLGLFWFCCYKLGITVFVEGGKHDERAIGGYVLPVVEADDDAMYGKKQIAIWFLPRLGDGIELAFV